MTAPLDIHGLLRSLVAGQSLTARAAEEVFQAVLAGELDASQIASVLSLIAMRGPTVDELVGGARVMRRHVTPVPIEHDAQAPLIDTCGTGGARKCFNVSTVAAVVAAAAAPGRIRVAKHGSTSRTGRGSAEVMAALGVNTSCSPETQARCLRELGVCFCWAVHHHPAMKHAAGPRKSLGFPTIFNLLGPLTNPAAAPRQLIGCYSITLAEKIAHTLARLGAEKAIVVSSHDGLDELSTTDTTQAFHVRDGRVTAQVIDAMQFGCARARLEELQTATVEAAAALARAILTPGQSGSLEGGTNIDRARDMTLLSAGAALVVGDAVSDIGAGIETARTAISSGNALRVLESLARLTSEPR
jgi:anthranilate phosphoribosyltransferase